MQQLDRPKAIELLNCVPELELAGVVRYTHYALMVFGHNRIPIIGWEQADESLLHARRAGELVTLLGGHPSLGIGPLRESHKHSIDDILRESLAHEMIADEKLHVDAVNKMLRAPGDLAP